ncbi:hypothetical protein [Spirosoma spitsbergense]|uniref:hypothetical protein n=1 Tax=Spirosoma spitsbergense TaxID=431554 RepID=UPI0003A6FB1D|nr:hypothetical protein [Spirosoma spitsbergense]
MKMLDVGLWNDPNGVPVLLNNDRLTFGALVDTNTGAILNPIRKAFDRGLIFRLVPRRTGEGQRVETKGSLHKFGNYGEHNADQFTATDLLLTLDQLVTLYGIDPFNSKINTIEFGVNVELPFPVAQLLDNLICYKNKPFRCDTGSKTPYHECRFQRFTVKLYDKGKQRGLDGNLLRVEVKVAKMVYFDKTGVRLNTLADLLTVTNYRPLGALLMDTFNRILFDDPTIKPDALTAREREIYRDGCNPRFWQIPDNLTTTQANTHNQRLLRTERRYRALLDKHRRGENRPAQTAALIAQTWEQLTTVPDHLLTRIDERRAAWQHLTKHGILPEENQAERVEVNKRNPPKTDPPQIPNSCNGAVINPPSTCHELTGLVIPDCGNLSPSTCHELTNIETPDLSRINPLYSGLQPDTVNTPTTTQPDPVICPVTGVLIEKPRPGQRFVSATMLRNDDDLMLMLDSQHRQYAKGSKEDPYSQAAHNARNKITNPPNTLRRRVLRAINGAGGGQLPLFPPAQMLILSDSERQTLNYWKGTPYELPI